MDIKVRFSIFALGFFLLAKASVIQPCADLSSNACALFARAKPDLCSDQGLAANCKRFCGLCPLECYHCPLPSRDPRLCTVKQSCSVGQRCLLREYRAVDGHREFIMTCVNGSICDRLQSGFNVGSNVLGKRDIDHPSKRDITLKCCNTDGCNKPQIIQVTTNTPTTKATTRVPTKRSTTRMTTTQVPQSHAGSTTIPNIVIVIPTEQPGHTVPACYKDIAIVLDSSGSIGSLNFRHLLDFIYQIVSSVQIGSQFSQIALETFSSQPHSQWNLTTHSTKKSMLNMVYKIQYVPGRTNTGSALEYVINNVFTSTNGDRPSAPNAVIVLTDGQSNNPTQTLSAAKHLHAESSDIIAVGIGSGINHKELQAIASTSSHVIDISSFSRLPSIANRVVALMCQ